jgi:hypothetical protein
MPPTMDSKDLTHSSRTMIAQVETSRATHRWFQNKLIVNFVETQFAFTLKPIAEEIVTRQTREFQEYLLLRFFYSVGIVIHYLNARKLTLGVRVARYKFGI